MDRQKYKSLLEFLGIDKVRQGEIDYGYEKFSFGSLMNEYNRQQAEKAVTLNVKNKDIMRLQAEAGQHCTALKNRF